MPTLKTILRRLFYAAACASMLLMLASLTLWPVSYFRYMYATYSVRGTNPYGIFAWNGGRAELGFRNISDGGDRLYITYLETSPARVPPWSYATWNSLGPFNGMNDVRPITFLGVLWYGNGEPGIGIPFSIEIPFSYLTLLFSLLPLLALRSLRRRRQLARPGLCPKCSYDLRAHAPGSLCPECGTPIK